MNGSEFASASEIWDVINRACQNPKSQDDVWNDAVMEAYTALEDVSQRAKAKEMLKKAIKPFIGVTGFANELDRQVREYMLQSAQGATNNFTFEDTGQEIKYPNAQYEIDENGIQHADEYGSTAWVCSHLIYVGREIEPIDDMGKRYVELHYKLKDKDWQTKLVPKSTICRRKEIVSLLEYGIDVTDVNDKLLIDYFRTIERLNPVKVDVGCGRFGWVENGTKFMPYADKVTFTGAQEYRDIYDAIKAKGTLEDWREAIRPFYKPDANKIPRMALAASVAAPIVGYMDDLPFFVHLFGASGHGKTVSLMLAASVWGNPKAEGGGLVQSFSSTAVGMERRAAVMCNMPMILDEVGVKGARDKEVSEIVYQLTEGVGKTRGSLEGLRQTGKWSTVFISSGEQPLTSDTSQAGVINRIISVDCNGQSIFGDDGARKLVEKIRNSYGHAGKMIVDKIMEYGRDGIRRWQRNMQELLSKVMPEGMNKQILAASWLMMADQMLQGVVFGEILDDANTNWLTRCIATKDEVDMLKRVLDWIEGWRGGNGRHFFDSANDAANGNSGVNADVWGFKRKAGVYAYNPTILKTEMEKNGFDYRAFISAAKAAGTIILDSKGKTTVPCRIGGGVHRFVVVTTPEEQAEYAEPKPPVILNMMPRSG